MPAASDSAAATAGFAYGFINSAYLHQGLFLIVTSYLLQSDRDVLSELEKVGALTLPRLAMFWLCSCSSEPLTLSLLCVRQA